MEKGRGYFYSLHYCIAWEVRGGKTLITEDMKLQLKELLRRQAKEKNVNIEDYQITQDKVQLQISCTPQHSLPDIIKLLKGTSARMIMKNYKEQISQYLIGAHVWEPTYYITTDINGGQTEIEITRKHK